jgi:hypothetical protein
MSPDSRRRFRTRRFPLRWRRPGVACSRSVRRLTRQAAEAWNTPAALALIGRARATSARRIAVDPERRSYQAAATGHVFFLADRPSTGERTLIKADRSRSRSTGRRRARRASASSGCATRRFCPTNIRYHLDHLTVVQDDFGGRHPDRRRRRGVHVLPSRGPGRRERLRLRARRFASPSRSPTAVRSTSRRCACARARSTSPGYVGSVYVDRASAAIVGMTFTFTPVSYVDSYLDYIRISLDNSLWEGSGGSPTGRRSRSARDPGAGLPGRQRDPGAASTSATTC